MTMCFLLDILVIWEYRALISQGQYSVEYEIPNNMWWEFKVAIGHKSPKKNEMNKNEQFKISSNGWRKQNISGRIRCIALKMTDASVFSGEQNIVLERLEELAEHRKHWREMIRHKREFLGAGHSNDWGDLIKYK